MEYAKVYSDRVEIIENEEIINVFEVSLTPGSFYLTDFNDLVTSGELTIIWHYNDDSYNKKHLKKLLAEKRYNVEVGGTTWNGHPTDTDRFSQGKITAAFVLAINGQWPNGAVWKFNDGICVPMSAQDILSLTGAIQIHVQSAFNTEAIKMVEIDATNTTDINAGW